MNLVIDDRERSVATILKSSEIEIIVLRITTADFALYYKTKLLAIFERKTWKDLAASMKDGRMQNNNKLLQMRTDSGCDIYYIIEGPAFPSDNRKFCGIKFRALQAKLDSLVIEHKIHMIYTKSDLHTANRLVNFLNMYKKKLLILHPDIVNETNSSQDCKTGGQDSKSCLAAITKTHKKPLAQIKVDMIKKIPAIGEQTALALLADNTVSEILSGNFIVPRELKLSSGNTIGTRAAKITRNLSKINAAVTVRVLECIPSVSRTVAAVIAGKFSMVEIIAGAEVADLMRPPNAAGVSRRLGPAVQKHIRELLFVQSQIQSQS